MSVCPHGLPPPLPRPDLLVCPLALDLEQLSAALKLCAELYREPGGGGGDWVRGRALGVGWVRHVQAAAGVDGRAHTRAHTHTHIHMYTHTERTLMARFARFCERHQLFDTGSAPALLRLLFALGLRGGDKYMYGKMHT